MADPRQSFAGARDDLDALEDVFQFHIHNPAD
jgi:hypothetical protein